MTHYQKAIQYVRDNHCWSEEKEQVALEYIGYYRCNIQQAFPSISDEIADLMEEYGQDNDLPEGWWLEEGDEDDVFFQL